MANNQCFSQEKSSVITYNGEIYNYKELKKNLIKRVLNLKIKLIRSLLNGLIDQGPSFINKCNGMFAFAYYNKKKKSFLHIQRQNWYKTFIL